MFSRGQKILHTDRYALFIYKIKTGKTSSSTEKPKPVSGRYPKLPHRRNKIIPRLRAVSKTSPSTKTQSYPVRGRYLKLPHLQNHIPSAGGIYNFLLYENKSYTVRGRYLKLPPLRKQNHTPLAGGIQNFLIYKIISRLRVVSKTFSSTKPKNQIYPIQSHVKIRHGTHFQMQTNRRTTPF